MKNGNGGATLSKVLPTEGDLLAALANEGLHKLRVVFYEETDSTNTRAKLFAESEEGAANKAPVLFVAKRQSAGRGRRGRSFASGGAGLYMSLLLYPTENCRDAVKMTAHAAVAAARAVEELAGASPRIKWVNDLYLCGKKIAGILTEGKFDADTGGFSYAIIGIGINVLKTEFPPELAEIAADIESLTGKAISTTALAAKIARELIFPHGELGGAEIISEYRERSFLIGRRVTVMRAGAEYPATVSDINENAELIVIKDDGTRELLSSGEVSVREEK